MSDDVQTQQEAFLWELDELARRAEVDFRGRVAQNKDKAFSLLAPLGVKRLLVHYDGSGDEGAIDEMVCRDHADAVIELPARIREEVEDLVCESLPCGWEINEGSYGSVEFDIATKKAKFWHAQRVVEIAESEWEG